jgi:hypothetical protein
MTLLLMAMCVCVCVCENTHAGMYQLSLLTLMSTLDDDIDDDNVILLCECACVRVCVRAMCAIHACVCAWYACTRPATTPVSAMGCGRCTSVSTQVDHSMSDTTTTPQQIRLQTSTTTTTTHLQISAIDSVTSCFRFSTRSTTAAGHRGHNKCNAAGIRNWQRQLRCVCPRIRCFSFQQRSTTACSDTAT